MSEVSEFWCYEPKDIKYELLDPGIREVVRFLVGMGFHTTDSGDGESKRARGWTEEDGLIPAPHVFMSVNPDEIAVAARDLVGCLKGIGITVGSQTTSWAEIVEEHGNEIKLGEVEVRPAPYIEVTYDPVDDRAIMGLYWVTSDMIKTAG